MDFDPKSLATLPLHFMHVMVRPTKRKLFIKVAPPAYPKFFFIFQKKILKKGKVKW